MSPGASNTNELHLALARIKALGEANMNDYQRALIKWHRNVDKRYAWVVLTALFLMMTATLGPYRVYGLIYARVTSSGEYTREEASWPVSTIFTVENLIGPFVSVVTYNLSYRQSMFIGGLLLTLGNTLATFSDSLWCDVLLLGVIQGVGYAFMFMPFMEIINNYFLKYRNSALGFALCGGTLSIFLWSPIFQKLLDTYPWRYSYLGIGLICSIILLMVPLLRANPMPQMPSDMAMMMQGGAGGGGGGTLKAHFDSQLQRTANASTSNKNKEPATRKLSRISVRALTYQNSVRRQSSTIMISRGTIQRQASVISVNPFASSAGLERKISRVLMASEHSTIQDQTQQQAYGSAAELAKQSGKKLSQMPQHFTPAVNKQNYLAASEKQETGAPGDTLSLSEVGRDAEESEFELSIVWKILKTPGFHLIWYNELIYFWVFSIYCLVLVDYSVDRGCALEDAESMLNFQSIGELLGRLVLPIIVDLRLLSNKNTVVVILFILAGLLTVVTQINGYLWMACITSAVSAFISLLYIMLNGLLVDYLGERQVTIGYGLASCVGGLLMSFRPFAVGYFRDTLGSYDLLMLCLALSCAIGAVLWLVEPLIERLAPKLSATNGSPDSGQSGCTSEELDRCQTRQQDP